MSWKCPSCGRQNYGTFNNCLCGYFSSEVVLTKHGLMECQRISEGNEQCRDVPLNGTSDGTPSLQGTGGNPDLHALGTADPMGHIHHGEVIKEIDSWLFRFSGADGCISIGTPALQSFKLKLTLTDLEELLEFLYAKTGIEKTTRKISIATTDIAGVIDKVDRMIEEKKSKIFLQFTGDELQEIADFINLQLKL